MGRVVEEQGDGAILLRDFQRLNLEVGRRGAKDAKKISKPVAGRDAHRPLLPANRLGNQREHLVGQPAAVRKIARHDLNRSRVVVGPQQDQVRRRDLQLIAARFRNSGVATSRQLKSYVTIASR